MFTKRTIGTIALALTMSLFSPAARSSAGDGADDKKPADTAKAPAANAAAPATDKSAANSATEAELQALREELALQRAALEAQQNKIEALELLLHAAPATASTSAAVQPASTGSAATTTAVSTTSALQVDPQNPGQSGPQQPEDLSKRVANLEDRVKNFGPFTFSGDFRLRDEPWFGGPANQSLDRNRERYRLRLNIDAKLNDDFVGGFAFATGDVNDPITTNQTATQFYTRKPFSLDRAFISYTPHELKYLTLTGGKFAYPWYNTELTWDKDLNPEGLAQTLAFNLESTPVLKRIAFVGFELPFAEVAGVSTNDKSIVQSAMYGGQLQTVWQLAHWLKFSAYTGFYNFHNADPIAVALAKASAKNPATPFVGLLPLGSGGNTVQNSIVTTTASSVVTIDGTAYPTGISTITNAQFQSKFGLFDSIARFDIRTPSERWPVTFIGDYVQNTEACANAGNILPAPANTATATYTQSTNAPCASNQRRGYWLESQVGRAQKRGDWQFGYTRIFIEREAVLSNFDYSELRQGSNVTEHRVSALYQVHRNVQLAFLGLIGRPLNFAGTAPPENLLKRLQFDVLYTF